MRRTSLLIAAGTLLVGMAVTSPARAQDTTRVQSMGEVSGVPSFTTLVGALDSTSQSVARLGALSTLKESDIRFQDVGTLVNGRDADFKAALERNNAAITELRTSLDKNAVISRAIAARDPKLTSADIVAVNLGKDGAVTVFYKPNKM